MINSLSALLAETASLQRRIRFARSDLAEGYGGVRGPPYSNWQGGLFE
tara:strand:- start:744 stop:887 length:144 start_codon:yes stop_codon:yes gene_type:complete